METVSKFEERKLLHLIVIVKHVISYFNVLLVWLLLLQPHQNSLILHAFMDLFCSFIRVNLLSEKASPANLNLLIHFFQLNLL